MLCSISTIDCVEIALFGAVLPSATPFDFHFVHFASKGTLCLTTYNFLGTAHWLYQEAKEKTRKDKEESSIGQADIVFESTLGCAPVSPWWPSRRHGHFYECKTLNGARMYRLTNRGQILHAHFHMVVFDRQTRRGHQSQPQQNAHLLPASGSKPSFQSEYRHSMKPRVATTV